MQCFELRGGLSWLLGITAQLFIKCKYITTVTKVTSSQFSTADAERWVVFMFTSRDQQLRGMIVVSHHVYNWLRPFTSSGLQLILYGVNVLSHKMAYSSSWAERFSFHIKWSAADAARSGRPFTSRRLQLVLHARSGRHITSRGLQLMLRGVVVLLHHVVYSWCREERSSFYITWSTADAARRGRPFTSRGLQLMLRWMIVIPHDGCHVVHRALENSFGKFI